jgi:hypothetical protein
MYETYFPTELVTKVKPNINSVDEVHPQLSNTRHPMDDALMDAGSLWPLSLSFSLSLFNQVV